MELSELRDAVKALEALAEETLSEANDDYHDGNPSMEIFGEAWCLHKASEICQKWIDVQSEDEETEDVICSLDNPDLARDLRRGK